MSYPTNRSLTVNNNTMKTSFFIAAFCLLFLSTFLVWSKFENHDKDISIAVSDNDELYTFDASYSEGNTGRVQDYINKRIKPNSLFSSTHDYLNVSTSLSDNTEFHLKGSPGNLKIELDKKKNSTASYYRIKTMCDGIGKLLAGK